MAKSKSELRKWLDGLASEAAEQTRLYDGQKEVSVDIDSSKKTPILKK